MKKFHLDRRGCSRTQATVHTAVLIRSFRNHTMLLTRLIRVKWALSCDAYDSFLMYGMSGANRKNMRLGVELPLLEVAYRGQVYRILVRPVDDQDASIRKSDLVCELVRTVAPHWGRPAAYALRDADGHKRGEWTLFLEELDKKNPRLAAYVTSSMAVKEFRDSGVAAMREALKTRAPHALVGVVPRNYTGFLSAFLIPEYQTIFYRGVGTSADWF